LAWRKARLLERIISLKDDRKASIQKARTTSGLVRNDNIVDFVIAKRNLERVRAEYAQLTVFTTEEKKSITFFGLLFLAAFFSVALLIASLMFFPILYSAAIFSFVTAGAVYFCYMLVDDTQQEPEF
jgi:hypothetical protein